MAQKVTITKTTKTRRRKYGGNTGYVKCNMCNGTGRHKKPKRQEA